MIETDLRWSPQQDAAIATVREWLGEPRKSRNPVFRLFGYAGTGKTTLAQELARTVKGTVLYATFTGKAALVLRSKGCEDASTIHSLIYNVIIDEATGDAKFVLNELSALSGAALLIVDEVSMVGEGLARDLLSFGTPILVIGDPAQLPPVKDEGFFINAEPDVMLTEVHRQARENPIIRMSMDIREGKRLRPGTYGESMVVRPGQISREALGRAVVEADQVLCGLNRTRLGYNRRIRELKSLRGTMQLWHPATGDRLICLRNENSRSVFNGSMWNVEDVMDMGGRLDMRVGSLDENRDPINVAVFEEFFNGTEHQLEWRERRKCMEFTFGWAITCHKAQGSQWNNVLIFDESGAFRDASMNWLYTAVTRAAERVTVVI